MIYFFSTPAGSVIATQANSALTAADIEKLCWLYGEATPVEGETMEGYFIGPRREMITPWSTNAVEITQNMGLTGIARIEEYFAVKDENAEYDPMLQRMYHGLDQEIFTVDIQPKPIEFIEDLDSYNEQEGLALSKEEIDYLHRVEGELGRKLTDSEVFGFAQINSEHCRHKIFGGTFIIDGEEMPSSLFAMIKRTTNENRNSIISAYKDNVAFAQGLVGLAGVLFGEQFKFPLNKRLFISGQGVGGENLTEVVGFGHLFHGINSSLFFVCSSWEHLYYSTNCAVCQ